MHAAQFEAGTLADALRHLADWIDANDIHDLLSIEVDEPGPGTGFDPRVTAVYMPPTTHEAAGPTLRSVP
ncbi:MAG: hypothetical protein ACRDT4_05585 [Micromonosporaceae bacterium]